MDWHQLFEPEETIGKLWHRLVGQGASLPAHADASVAFEAVQRRLPVFFRGLGGEAGIDIEAATATVSRHRLGLRQRLGHESEKVARASFDGERLLLPDTIAAFPDAELNERLYFWLTAWIAASSGRPPRRRDPWQADIARLRFALKTTAATMTAFPGLRPLYERLASGHLKQRPQRDLPPQEAAVEMVILALLGADVEPQGEAAGILDPARPLASFIARESYRPPLPVPLWADLLAGKAQQASDRDDSQSAGAGEKVDDKVRKASRRESDQIDRPAPFIAHRFEKILTWAEFMNLHRDVEDDEAANAKKAADDHDELGLAQTARTARTKLAFDLDLSPAERARDALSGSDLYPEWDHRSASYMKDHVRVLHDFSPVDPAASWTPDERARRRIRAVKRRFEALRPKRQIIKGAVDGFDLDTDAVIRARADFLARGEGSDRVWLDQRREARDLAVAVLIDVSRSTESWADERAVIDVEKEALVALTEGISACGDTLGVFAFSSLRRDRVWVHTVKDFEEKVSADVRARIASLKPGHYTRLGGAIRHVSRRLADAPHEKRLLIVITDGKPNDLDHYEGRHGVEDSRKAVQEARRAGHAVFGITVDARARSYFPHIFGAGGYSIVARPSKLTKALPVLYRQLVN